MEVLQRPTSSTIVGQAITLYDLLRNPNHVLAQRKNDSYEILEVKYFSFSLFIHFFYLAFFPHTPSFKIRHPYIARLAPTARIRSRSA